MHWLSSSVFERKNSKWPLLGAPPILDALACFRPKTAIGASLGHPEGPHQRSNPLEHIFAAIWAVPCAVPLRPQVLGGPAAGGRPGPPARGAGLFPPAELPRRCRSGGRHVRQ